MAEIIPFEYVFSHCGTLYLSEIAKPAEPVNGQDERRIRAAVDSLARLCRQAIKGRQQGVLPPHTIIRKGEFPRPKMKPTKCISSTPLTPFAKLSFGTLP